MGSSLGLRFFACFHNGNAEDPIFFHYQPTVTFLSVFNPVAVQSSQRPIWDTTVCVCTA